MKEERDHLRNRATDLEGGGGGLKKKITRNACRLITGLEDLI